MVHDMLHEWQGALQGDAQFIAGIKYQTIVKFKLKLYYQIMFLK